ncbi:MAG: hypothetical protein FWE05_03540 [Defluviitaleaceae bacterium]|nr:hypothetical protein [Defluviitaleaceae bacterium]
MMNTVIQSQPYVSRGMEQAGGIEQPAVPVEKPTKLPETVALKPDVTPMQTERLTELLRGYAMKATEENINLLKIMLENGIPLTKENILQMNQAMKLAGSQDNALFMMENNMRLTQSNAAQLDGFVSGQTKIMEQLSNLMKAIEQLQDKTLVTQLKQMLSNGGDNNIHRDVTPSKESVIMQSQPQLQIKGEAGYQISKQNVSPTLNTPPSIPPTAQSTMQITVTMGPHQPTEQVATHLQSTTQVLPNIGQQAPQSPIQTEQVMPSPPQTEQHTQFVPPLADVGELVKQTQPSFHPSTKQFSAQPQTPPSLTSELNQPSPTLPQGLLFHLADSTSEDITHYLNNLREAMTQIQQTLSKQESSEDITRVLQEARAVETHIDFTTQIKNQTFIQLPIFYNGQESQTALHIYKDAKKSLSSSSGSSSALIALETAGMGHFETYVQKNVRSVHCQFRLESDKIVQAVRNNIHKLDALLKNFDYGLDSFSFLPPGDPYTLLDNPKTFEDLSDTKISIHHFDKKA